MQHEHPDQRRQQRDLAPFHGGAIGRLRKRLKRAKTDEERATIEALIDEASEVRKVKGERSRAVRSADRKWSITTKALARIRKVTKKTEDPECRVKLEKLEKKAVGRLRDMQPPRVSPMKASASLRRLAQLSIRSCSASP